MISRRILRVLVVLSLLASPCLAAPWHAGGWSDRAEVMIRDENRTVDVATVRIHHVGRAAPDGRDYRIFDDAGHAVPYQLDFHDPKRDTFISFRTPKSTDRVYVYFGNHRAEPDPMAAVFDITPGAPGAPGSPGSGAPKPGRMADGWIPRAGLILITMRRPPDAPNPTLVQELIPLIAKSPGLDGAGYRAGIADSWNPFGDSDHYISIYRGWIRIPHDGPWTFATASNEASFSFINGGTLIHWPGRHTDERARRGQRNAQHQLAAGDHFIEYYHEETTLAQMAFLGVKAPGNDKFERINELVRQPRRSRVVRHERASGELSVTIEPTLVDVIQPQGPFGPQYTRFRFVAATDRSTLRGWNLRWSTGDGPELQGPAVEYVYLSTGPRQVTLHATPPQGDAITLNWPLDVFTVEQPGMGFAQGKMSDYIAAAEGYDVAAMRTSAAAALAAFHMEAGNYPLAARCAHRALQRDDVSDADRARLALIVVGDAGTFGWLWTGDFEMDKLASARSHLGAALASAPESAVKLEIIARLIRLSGAGMNDTAEAARLHELAGGIVRDSGSAGPMRLAHRQVMLAMGDVYLRSQRFPDATTSYEMAERMAANPYPAQVRAARSGSYPQRVRHHLTEGRLADAASAVAAWCDELPADMVNGASLFWQGKVSLASDRPLEARRALELAVRVGTGTEHEAEARWLLAESCRRLGDAGAREAALRGLIATGIAGEWRDKAIAALTNP